MFRVFRFGVLLPLPAILLASVCCSAEETRPLPDAAYGRIELSKPLPERAEIYANWLHDRENQFRILVPPMSKVYYPEEPIQIDTTTILLKIEPFEMLGLEIGLIPKSIGGQQLSAEQILESISADEKTAITNLTSTVGTQWTGRGYRTKVEDEIQQSMTMLTSKSEDSFVFARIQSRFLLELRTAMAIVDSFSFVEAGFQLKQVLTLRETSQPQTDFVPSTTARAWFEDDQPNGLITHEDERGRRVHTLTTLNGQQSGLELRHWPGGNVYRLRLFEKGKPQVQSLSFYESGELHSMSVIRNGALEGETTSYYRDGSVSITAAFKGGLLEGTMLHYLPDGKLIGRTYYEDGQCVGEESAPLTPAEIASSHESVLDPRSVWSTNR